VHTEQPLQVEVPPSLGVSPSRAGIEGWLLLFTVGLVPHFLLSGSRILAAVRGAADAGGPGLILAIVSFVGHGVGLLLILRRHRLTPVYFCGYQPLLIVIALLTPGLATLQATEAVRLGVIASTEQIHFLGSAPVRNALVVAVTGVWLGYWMRSQRVRATFGSAGLESLTRGGATQSDSPA
jgi:hypothetical protein